MKRNPSRTYTKQIIGWREWVALPDLGITCIKAKIDSGARTSALHAFSLEVYTQDKQQRARFLLHPIQKDEKTVVQCEADVIDERWVMDSGGHKELRYVIRTALMMNNTAWPIEVTLTKRDTMGFRMLLGRSAIKGRFLVNPYQSFLTTNNKR